MKPNILLLVISIPLVLLSGCSNPGVPGSPVAAGPQDVARNENALFLQQSPFDPWKLATHDPAHLVAAYVTDGKQGHLYDSGGRVVSTFQGGRYSGGVIVHGASPAGAVPAAASYQQTLDLRDGSLTTVTGGASSIVAPRKAYWRRFWAGSDIQIDGDAEAQQVTHANLFYLCGSMAPESASSVPPMGLSSVAYNGHIFWDAEIWMFPALIVQHPDLAKTIIDYRFQELAQAEKNAHAHGYAGAEYPWESADTGREEAPEEFAQERHITADVAYAAWQYYLWTGDRAYLSSTIWPILNQTAAYWVSRVKLGADGQYHIERVIGPDETAGVVDDDAWTNAVVQYNLRAASTAARVLGKSPNPRWQTIAARITLLTDAKSQIVLEYKGVSEARQQSKQADSQMLIYPLDLPLPGLTANTTLDYCLKHTIVYGPAMTSSINAVIATRLGRARQSLDLFRDSYRPFERGPFDAFSEKRTTSNVYFCTGMGGCLQAVLYGFAGLNVVDRSSVGRGKLVATASGASLYADPHLPPGWNGLTLHGVKFHGATVNVAVLPGNSVRVTSAAQ